MKLPIFLQNCKREDIDISNFLFDKDKKSSSVCVLAGNFEQRQIQYNNKLSAQNIVHFRKAFKTAFFSKLVEDLKLRTCSGCTRRCRCARWSASWRCSPPSPPSSTSPPSPWKGRPQWSVLHETVYTYIIENYESFSPFQDDAMKSCVSKSEFRTMGHSQLLTIM